MLPLASIGTSKPTPSFHQDHFPSLPADCEGCIVAGSNPKNNTVKRLDAVPVSAHFFGLGFTTSDLNVGAVVVIGNVERLSYIYIKQQREQFVWPINCTILVIVEMFLAVYGALY